MSWRWQPSACTVFARPILYFVPNSTAFRCASSLKGVNLWWLVAKRLSNHFRHCADDCRGYDSPSGSLHLIAQFGQSGLHLVAMITLDFDIAVFDCAAGAA